MILFSPICEVSDSVVVDDYIWTAMGLQADLKYHLTLPGHRDRRIGNEILCAPEPSRNWKDLWYLKIALYDRAGLLADLTNLLQHSDLDILSCRAETTEPHGIVNFEMHIDSQRYNWTSARVGSTETGAGPTLPAVRGKIVAKFIEELVFVDHQPLLSLWRVLPLYMATERIDLERIVDLEDRRIPMPEEMVRRIREDASRVHKHLSREPPPAPVAALRADTEARLLRVMLLFPGTGHMALRIRVSSELGTLAILSSYMRNVKLNMIQLSTTLTGGGHAFSDVILHVPDHQLHWVGRDRPETVRALVARCSRVEDCEIIWSGLES